MDPPPRPNARPDPILQSPSRSQSYPISAPLAPPSPHACAVKPGLWPMYCQVHDHSEAGMQASFVIAEPPSKKGLRRSSNRRALQL